VQEEHKALPNFRKEIDPILNKAAPGASREEIERLKSLFIQSKPRKAFSRIGETSSIGKSENA
jgi:hypothetical protein